LGSLDWSHNVYRISIRLDGPLHDRLERRARGAGLPLAAFARSVLAQAADPNARYIYSSQDEILATCIQLLAIIAASVGHRSPDILRKGMEDARALLRERGLLGDGDAQ
jgi:RHH-type rel operon transcriptional repressor/antitoxin RelB